MERWQKDFIAHDLEKKIVLLAGPRQAGKTTLAKSLRSLWPNLYYLNWDSDADRPVILKQRWDRQADLVVLDEYHKLKAWKSRIKGIYDTEKIPPRILITGSARLDFYRRGGDSLAGRYFLHRLYPFSVAELKKQIPPPKALEQLSLLGGFPEPLLGQSEESAKRWRQQYFETVVRQDIQDLEPIREVTSLLLLIDLLRERVGSRISYKNLAQDIQVSPHSVKSWIEKLERMYVIFRVTPYHRNLARSILKEPKIYFYDSGAVRGDEGLRLENTVAVCLKKWLHFLEDTQGKDVALHYLSDKEKHEVDFLTVIDKKARHLIEVKLSETQVHPALSYFHNKIQPQESVQLVQRITRTTQAGAVRVTPAAHWLAALDI